MTCHTCKQPILENEEVKQVMTACPDAGTGNYKNGVQCSAYHTAMVHVNDCIRPPSEIEQLEKRIEELEDTVKAHDLYRKYHQEHYHPKQDDLRRLKEENC